MSMSLLSVEEWTARVVRLIVLVSVSAAIGAHAQTSTTRPPQRFEALARDILGELTEQDGWVYGRGMIDMKGQDAAVLTRLIRMKQEGIVPARDIIVAFTCDEEARGVNGVEWLLKEHHDLVDAAIVVNPDGGEAG